MSQTPSPVVSRWLPILRDRLGDRRDLLDLAMGAGRYARAAAGHGFRVFGVDRDLDRVRLARTGALEHARLWVADLETATLPRDRFDLVICTNYLQRSIWPALRDAVRAGGFVIYETFTVAQLAHSTGPRSPDHLLRPGELRAAFDGWELCHDEECTAPAGVARLVARKRAARSGHASLAGGGSATALALTRDERPILVDQQLEMLSLLVGELQKDPLALGVFEPLAVAFEELV